jgi:hypothetical protein
MIDSFQSMALRHGNRTFGVFTTPEKQAAASVSSLPLFLLLRRNAHDPLA